MKRTFLYLLIANLLLSVFPGATATAQDTPSGQEPESGAVVCPPDVYLAAPGDCLPLGPSTYITEMATLGLTFPQRTLPASRPDPALTQLP